MIAVPRVWLPTLNTDMLVLALITKPAPQRAIEEGAPARAIVLECRDRGPLLSWDPSITRDLVTLPILLLLRILQLSSSLSDDFLLPFASSFILPSFGRRRSIIRELSLGATIGCHMTITVSSLLELIQLRTRAGVIPQLLVVG